MRILFLSVLGISSFGFATNWPSVEDYRSDYLCWFHDRNDEGVAITLGSGDSPKVLFVERPYVKYPYSRCETIKRGQQIRIYCFFRGYDAYLDIDAQKMVGNTSYTSGEEHENYFMRCSKNN